MLVPRKCKRVTQLWSVGYVTLRYVSGTLHIPSGTAHHSRHYGGGGVGVCTCTSKKLTRDVLLYFDFVDLGISYSISEHDLQEVD